MHGQQTMKHLNDKAVADAILASRKAVSPVALDPKLVKAMEDVLAQKAIAKSAN